MPRVSKAELEARLTAAMTEKTKSMSVKELQAALGGFVPALAASPKAVAEPKAAKATPATTKRRVVEKQTTVELPNGDKVIKIVRPFIPAPKDVAPAAAVAAPAKKAKAVPKAPPKKVEHTDEEVIQEDADGDDYF